jgi:hypothetical protein
MWGFVFQVMSDCMGDMPVSTKVDKSMLDFLNAEAERCGVTRSELLRRVLDDYRDSRADQLKCPECETVLHIDPNNATDS